MKWEYRTIAITSFHGWLDVGQIDAKALETTLNDLGGEGWELVSMVGRHAGGSTRELVLVLKRPSSG